MDLNSVNVEIRPRPPYEGLDLGFKMASKWFLTLWGLWLATALPVGSICFLFFYDSPFWGAFCFWWFKPLFETPLLFWISRMIFNENPEISHILKTLFRITKPQLFWRLTVKRLSLSRSFFMPIMLLENMKGSDYAKRAEILGRNQSAGYVLTFICLLFEGVLYFSAVALLNIIIPDTLEFSEIGFFFDEGVFSVIIDSLFIVLSMSVIAPFYICAGFALYLTRRTTLEAWDIELNFKRLIKRKQELKTKQTAMMILFCGVLLLTNLPDLQASEQDRDQSKKTIETVLSNKEFGQKKTIPYWKLKNIFPEQEKQAYEPNDFLLALSQFFAGLVKPLIWIAGGILVVFLVYYLAKYLGYTQKMVENQKSKPPDELFGLKITGETLPNDLMAEIEGYLDSHDFRSALSLLYRGTLYKLIFDGFLDIPKSATEGECVTLVASNKSPDEAVFFKSLTGVWLKLAYGHIQPDRELIETLCASWHGLYGQMHG